MVLTKESEEFIANLKMYLMTSGKNDKEIEDIAEELRAHLEDAESRGKTLDSVTGGSPESYLKNISEEMKTDYFGVIKALPMFILLVAAYFITGSAIRGDLSFSLLKLIAFPSIAALGVAGYIFFFRRSSAQNWSAKRQMIAFGTIYVSLSAALSAVIFLDLFMLEPFYVPSRDVMWIIAAAGVAVFVISAIWSKTWITIILPLFLFGPDFIMHFMEVSEMRQLFISAASLYIGMAFVIVILFIQNKKQT
ncbi:HAAS domain-containing protein [Planococcus salinus]|uniref:HAAS transmembrane region domain-containing protein n=1 Tax=Planococcus salinus TaxID=1848460 RepID=A0A3M8P8T4_9BACL|nr:hypothetical protein [Planococcus salinus]RNF40077.1 hypothetical protein EEX84_05410 [Planococcus salinus]